MLHFLQRPWPWYVAGPLIGLTVPLLLLLGNRQFGISSTLRHICAACIPGNITFFQYNWKQESWNLFFAA
ncbi:MAG TPA: YeeE/YedE family protein, partial [Chitinophaga sp.]